jgi:hypothetical protein
LGGIQSSLEKFKPQFLRLAYLDISRIGLHPHTLVAEPHPRLAPDFTNRRGSLSPVATSVLSFVLNCSFGCSFHSKETDDREVRERERR